MNAPVKDREPLIDSAPLFSAPEPVLRDAETGSRPPATNPFQAPEFEESAAPGTSTAPATDPSPGSAESASADSGAGTGEQLSDPFAAAERQN